jgi:plastocyanin
MLNHLDSRALGRADCYAQRFMKAGVYPYNVIPAHGQALSTEYPFAIRVEENDKMADMVQHTLRVSSRGKGFTVENTNVAIKVGDMVVWNGGSDSLAPFAVVGKHDFFSSYRMVNECGFSHAFGTPGEYRWIDAYGSGLSGIVRVRNPDCSSSEHLKRWQQSLAEGTVLMITDGKSDRGEVDIVTGQTVFFAVVRGPGISITEAQLLDIPTSDGCGDGDNTKPKAKGKSGKK